MRSISDTIARLSLLQSPHDGAEHIALSDRLSDLSGFGSNPGALRAVTYIPKGLRPGAPLVVVLHGCRQTAAAYDHGSGWSQLADRNGFALLFPEQQRSNNAFLCFNWLVPGDLERDVGEALSIRQMVDKLVRSQALDPTRIFVTGLSAGGAMTSVMLATYPDVFAGGAIIAGLPYGCAATIPEAFDLMRGGPSKEQLAEKIPGASTHVGPWPKISVWHGSADNTVSPSNAIAIVEQWRAVRGLDLAPTRIEVVGGCRRLVWCDEDGRELIDAYTIAGMGHGVPIDTADMNSVGASGAFMIDVGISSTLHIAHFWGLTSGDLRGWQMTTEANNRRHRWRQQVGRR